MAKGVTWEITEDINNDIGINDLGRIDLSFIKYTHGKKSAKVFYFVFRFTLEDLKEGVIRSSEDNFKSFKELTALLDEEFVVPDDLHDTCFGFDECPDGVTLCEFPIFRDLIRDFLLHSGYRIELMPEDIVREDCHASYMYLAYPL